MVSTIMKPEKYIKVSLMAVVFCIALAGKMHAQVIVPAHNREPGVCSKVDSTGHPYTIIYTIPAQDMQASAVQNTKPATSQIPDTVWAEPRLTPMSRKLKTIHAFDSIRKEDNTQNSIPSKQAESAK